MLPFIINLLVTFYNEICVKNTFQCYLQKDQRMQNLSIYKVSSIINEIICKINYNMALEQKPSAKQVPQTYKLNENNHYLIIPQQLVKGCSYIIMSFYQATSTILWLQSYNQLLDLDLLQLAFSVLTQHNGYLYKQQSENRLL